MKQTILICGFRRSGKDHFGSLLCTPRTSNFSTPYWKLYGKYNSFKLIGLNPVRKAFADKLKEEVSENYNIPLTIPEQLKDAKIFEREGEYFSSRDLYIEWSNYRRSQDPDYWIKKCIEDPLLNSGNNGSTLIITDWRYYNEVNYLSLMRPCVTIRVYRSNVPEPSLLSHDEHQLDRTSTDFLAVTSEEEFILATRRFAQYEKYVFVQDVY